MNKPNETTMTNDRVMKYLSLGLAAMLAIPTGFAQPSPADISRLQEENAALRKRLAELEGRAAPAAPGRTAPAASATVVAPAAAASVGEDVTVLSPFEVKSDKDYGYLKTNSATATRIGMEIQKVPLSISVLSEDFINDTRPKDIQDVLRYQASSAGDTKMNILQPATGFTPSGNMSLRGFPINSRLRNGLLRYNAYSLDNVERVELIKGPAAIFFGNAYPGGVINYVTKQPSFSKIPTSLSYTYGGYDTRMGTERITLDNNTVLSDKAALRVVGAWDHMLGDERFEFQKGFSINGGLTLVPLKDGRLRIALEGETLRRTRNQDDFSWVYPQGWFDAYKAPPANLIAAAGLSTNADPVGAYRTRILGSIGNWIADVRTAAGDPLGIKTALWTAPMKHGAYITDKAGNRFLDQKFNYYGMGSNQDEENSTFAAVTDFAATSWLDLRHSFSSVNSRYNRQYSAAIPLADGIRFNQIGQVGPTLQGYEVDAKYHQLDLVFKANFAGINNKVLVGGLYAKSWYSFTASNNAGTGTFPYYGNLPGAWDKPDEGYVSPINVALRAPATNAGARYDLEFVRDRNGKIMTPQEIFSLYDPGIHPSPDIRRITQVDRGLVDHSRPTRKEWYVNWQANAFQDRLTTFVGYRKEKQSTVGQVLDTNAPWFVVPEFALDHIPSTDWPTYGLNPVFARARTTLGSSKMAGASFAVKKNINVYASFSQTFTPPGVQYIGGDTNPDDVKARATLLGLNPDTEYARVLKEGFFTEVQNEKGKNMEVGLKVALDDNKLVGSASLFRVRRENVQKDDLQKQFDEKLNYLPTGASSRVVRWFTATAVQENEGLEFDLVWTPKRNFQSFISGSWMWKSKTLADPTLTTILPTTSPATLVSRDIVFANRLPFAPEYRLNTFNKFTFTENFLGDYGRGASIGLGARYASEIIISNDINYNRANGGLTAGNYVVFQTALTYPVEVFGYRMSASLNIDNLTDKEYSEGSFALSPGRSWMLTLGMKF